MSKKNNSLVGLLYYIYIISFISLYIIYNTRLTNAVSLYIRTIKGDCVASLQLLINSLILFARCFVTRLFCGRFSHAESSLEKIIKPSRCCNNERVRGKC